MAPATLEMTIQAAENLKDLAMFGKMSVYAVTWVDHFAKRTTRVRHKGGKNPVWNEWITLSLESVRHLMHAFLTVQIFSKASMGDKVVGTARLSLLEIYRLTERAGDEPALVSLALQRPSGRSQGILSLSLHVTGDYRPLGPSGFSGQVGQAGQSGQSGQPGQPGQSGQSGQAEQLTRQTTSDKVDDLEPVMGIPVGPYPEPAYYGSYAVATTSAGYPSLASTGSRDHTASGSEIIPYANPYPQYQNYPYYGTYPAPQAPYSYIQAPRPQSRSNGSILLGLLGGAIGGLILGDILS